MTDLEDRLRALRGSLPTLGIDAMLVEQPSNRRYLTGFSGSNGLAVITADSARLITDSRYYGRVEAEAPHFELVRAGNAMLQALETSLKELGANRVGLEADFVTVDYKRRMVEKLPDVEWSDTVGVVADLRAIKSAREIQAIKASAELTDAAMHHAYEVARPGMTEAELAWRLELFMRDHGAQGTAFDFIVGGGPNGALPHHESGARPLAVGEPIVVDIGARMGGYNADLTRTFTWGPAHDADYERVWDLVDVANRTSLETITPGMTGRDADAVARDLIEAGGFGESFGHGLGHGVGMDIHELPRLGPSAGDTPIAAGMVMTIEPGIYLPGRFGVRIEDLAVMRDGRLERLSNADKVAHLSVPGA